MSNQFVLSVATQANLDIVPSTGGSPVPATPIPIPPASTPNVRTALVSVQNASTVSVGAPAISRVRTGTFALSAALSVLSTDATIATGQFTRDGSPIGPIMPIATSEGDLFECSLGWIDTVADFVSHTYAFRVSVASGTLVTGSGAGGIAVGEF